MMPPVLFDPKGNIIATGGGQGSFSYADTKVFGARQPAKIYVPRRFQINNSTGEVVFQDGTPIAQLLVAGGGGGAKAPGRRYYGSKATGFKPDGLVLIRLMKLD